MPLPGIRPVLATKPKATLTYAGLIKRYPASDTNPSGSDVLIGNIDIGAADPRRLVVIIGGMGRQGDLTAGNPTVKCGGVTMTRDANSNPGVDRRVRGYVWSAVVPTGGAVDVTVNWSSSLWKNISMNVFVLRNLDYLVAQGQYALLEATSAATITATLSSTRRQFMFMSECHSAAGTAVTYPAGLTEVLDESDGEAARLTAAYSVLETPLTNPTVTLAAAAAQRSIAAAVYQ